MLHQELKLVLKSNFADSVEAIKAVILEPSFVSTEETISVPISFSIMPNPSTGNFVFMINKRSAIEIRGDLIFYNIYGETIHQQKLVSEKTEIDLSHQSNGLYFVQLKTANKTYAAKVLLQK